MNLDHNLQSAALNATVNGIVLTDVTGSIIWVNPAFTTLTGYSYEEAVGKNPRFLKSGKHEDSYYENLWDTIVNGNVWKGETINKKKDGSFYLEEMTITPVLNEEKKISNFIAIKQDITHKKELETELNKYITNKFTSILKPKSVESVQPKNSKGRISSSYL